METEFTKSENFLLALIDRIGSGLWHTGLGVKYVYEGCTEARPVDLVLATGFISSTTAWMGKPFFDLAHETVTFIEKPFVVSKATEMNVISIKLESLPKPAQEAIKIVELKGKTPTKVNSGFVKTEAVNHLAKFSTLTYSNVKKISENSSVNLPLLNVSVVKPAELEGTEVTPTPIIEKSSASSSTHYVLQENTAVNPVVPVEVNGIEEIPVGELLVEGPNSEENPYEHDDEEPFYDYGQKIGGNEASATNGDDEYPVRKTHSKKGQYRNQYPQGIFNMPQDSGKSSPVVIFKSAKQLRDDLEKSRKWRLLPYHGEKSNLADLRPRLNERDLLELKKYIKYTGQTPFEDAFQNMTSMAQMSVLEMAKAYYLKFNEKLKITSAWRSAEYQVSVKKRFGTDAANPGWSPHHFAAIDIDRQGNASPQSEKLIKSGIGYKYGWYLPENITGEAWHWEHESSQFIRFDNSRSLNEVLARMTYKLSGFEIEGVLWKSCSLDSWAIESQARQIVDVYFKSDLGRGRHDAEDEEILRDFVTFALRAESNYCSVLVSHTGALGCSQFTKATGDQYGLTRPMHLQDAIIASIRFSQDNINFLRGKEMPVTPESIYLAYMIGGRGSFILYKALSGIPINAEENKTIKKVILPNLGKELREQMEGASVNELVQAYQRQFYQRFEEYIGDVNNVNKFVDEHENVSIKYVIYDPDNGNRKVRLKNL